MNLIEFISQPWHWSVTGLGIALVAFLLVYAGERFGLSSSFEAFCIIGGAGKKVPYFKRDWKEKAWLIVFAVGSAIGGYIGVTLLQSPEPVRIAADSVQSLTALGVHLPLSKAEGLGYIPVDLFNFSNLLTVKGFILMIVGGFLIGFGTRYADGCTSGHSISGIANLQPSSMVATIGFFIGGLITTHLLFPFIFSL